MNFLAEEMNQLHSKVWKQWDDEFRLMLMKTLPTYIHDFDSSKIEEYAKRCTSVEIVGSTVKELYLDYDEFNNKKFLFKYSDKLTVSHQESDNIANNSLTMIATIG